MTVENKSGTIKYDIPYTIFDLVPYKNNVGERVICVDDNNSDDIKVGEIFTIIEQTNEQFGYVRLDKFKDYPLKRFGSGRFKKLNATYDGKEYTLYLLKNRTID